MSKMRPELVESDPRKPFLRYRDTYFRVAQSVEKERALIRGQLRDNGNVCAIGSYFERGNGPHVPIDSKAIDEIAAYNDSLVDETPQERWRKVRSWLRFKIARMRKGLE